jgi:hypothetical protein
MSSIDSRNSRNSRLSISSFIGLGGGPAGEAQPDSAGKQADKLSNPALKSRSSFSKVKKLFRFSMTKGNTSNGQDVDVDMVVNGKPNSEGSYSPKIVDGRESNLLSSSINGGVDGSKGVPNRIDESLRNSRSSAMRNSHSNSIRDDVGLSGPTNGVGLARRLRHGLQQANKQLPIPSTELPDSISTPQLSAFQILRNQLAEIESLSERQASVLALAETFEKLPTRIATNRKDSLKKDIIAVQKNRGNRTVMGSVPPKVFEVGGEFDEAEVRKKFLNLKYGQSKPSILSDRGLLPP